MVSDVQLGPSQKFFPWIFLLELDLLYLFHPKIKYKVAIPFEKLC